MGDWLDRNLSAEYERKLAEKKDQKEIESREKANAEGKNTLYKQSRDDIKNGYNKNILEFYNVLSANSGLVFTPRNKFKISWNNPDISRNEGKIFTEFLNEFNICVESVELPDMEIRNGEVIDDGRGTYYAQSDSVLVPSSNELTVNYRDTETSVVQFGILPIIMWNSTPFAMPLFFNLSIDYFSDLDGTSMVAGYRVNGCRPISYNTIKAEHDGREINIRKIRFGFHNIQQYKVGEG